MKSEHRHELQTNELGKIFEKAAVWIDVHGNRLMIGVCLACLPLAGFIYWWRSDSNAQAAAWRDFSAAINTSKPEDFHAVWQDHPGTVPAYWARVHEGEQWLAEGVKKIFSNVELGTADLNKSRAAFQAVVDDPRRAPPELRDRALLGLGRALESTSAGNEAEAVKVYETLVKEFPDSIYKKDAEERITVLNRGSGQDFYAWFAKYPRPQAPVKGPRDRLSSDNMDEKSKDLLEKIESATKDTLEEGGGKSAEKPPANDDESLELPESDSPEAEKNAAKQDLDVGDGNSEPKPDSVPEPESKPDE